MNNDKCQFCNGTGKEKDADGCVWCWNTGKRSAQNLDATGEARQHQCEPGAGPATERLVAEGAHWVVCSPAWIEAGGNCATAPRLLCGHGQGVSHMHPAHQGEPVAEIRYMGYEPANHLNWVNGNELQLLPDGTKLYTHADPAEIDRLRAELVEWKERCQRNSDEAMNWMAKYDTLRAQLAERGSLLEEALGSVYVDAGRCESEAEHSDLIELSERIKANLSASAEPSAPAEIDERAAFEAHYLVDHVFESADFEVDGDRYVWQATQDRWEAWKARAALERKS